MTETATRSGTVPARPFPRRAAPVWGAIALVLALQACGAGSSLQAPASPATATSSGATAETTAMASRTAAPSMTAAASTTSAAASVAAPSASPTAPPSVTLRPSPAGPSPSGSQVLVLTFTGVGAARIGTTMAEFARVLGQPLQTPSDGGSGGPCWEAGIGRRTGEALAVLTESGRTGAVDRYAIYGDAEQPRSARPLYRTVSGIHLGSTTQDVKAAYPGRVKTDPHQYVPGGSYLSLEDGQGHAMVFETDEKGVVTTIRAGKVPQAYYIEGCA